jgi:hypothetical protein
MEDADDFFFQIPVGPEEVHQGAEIPGIELNRQGVDVKSRR